jgi:hypothetical protein
LAAGAHHGAHHGANQRVVDVKDLGRRAAAALDHESFLAGFRRRAVSRERDYAGTAMAATS